MPLNFSPSPPNGGVENINAQPKPTRKGESAVKTAFDISDPKYKMDDLIIDNALYDELTTVVSAQQCWNTVFVCWNLGSVIKERRNLFVNFYGDPGTGKTMAAHAIAYELKKSLICVNYADIESKYVGETSKNLTSLFSFAKTKNVIIFFDEADALLSKRVTNMNNATDVSVNQTRSVLLTLLNDFDGMVIFASNFISNYDPAFMRRIQYHIKFTLPNYQLRKKLWRMYVPPQMPNNLDFNAIAEKYEGISGSDISNAVLKAALKAAKYGEATVRREYFEEAICSIIESKKENAKADGIIIAQHPVSEEYALSQLKKEGVDLAKK